MKKHGVNKFIGLLLLLSLITSMLFSFVSFAVPYTGAYLYTGVDPVTGLPVTEVRGVNPTGQTFSGQNKIEMNAYNNAPILTSNTFNGSTDIDTAFTDITSNGNTYNGTTTLEYSPLTGGTLQSSGDSFRTTSVEASDADVSISNGTFNGALSINANSVSLGSITQMDSLLDSFYSLYYMLTQQHATTTNTNISVNNPYTGNTLTLTPCTFFQYRSTYNNSTNTYSYTTVRTYGTVASMLYYSFANIQEFLGQMMTSFVWNRTFTLFVFAVDPSGETYTLTEVQTQSSYRQLVFNYISTLFKIQDFWFHKFYEWFYPLDNTLPEYWRFYNTDTQEEEDIGLAGLMYNISWYLGQLYALQVESGPLTQLSEDVDAAADSMASMESQEESVISSISSGIDSFVPDLSELGAFTALAWCSNYLQQCWVSLGMYGTVIMIGLLLAVCMQFIGYFRYK